MRPRRHAFTIIEVMTSIAIGLALAVLSTSTFFQVRAIMRRTQARLELHNIARLLYKSMREQLSAMQQEGALYIETKADGAPGLAPEADGHSGEVRLTFLRGKLDNLNYDNLNNHLGAITVDLFWTQWFWDQRNHMLRNGSSGDVYAWWEHRDKVAGGMIFGGKDDKGRIYAAMTEPRRAAGADPKIRLNDGKWDPDNPEEPGDYDVVLSRLTPVARNVTAFELQVVLADGSTVSADGSSTAITPIDGDYVDGRVPSGHGATQPHLRRPRLFRVRLTLTDPETRLSLPFSFSFPAPGPLPPL